MNLSELEVVREGKKAEMASLLDARDQAARDFTNDEAARFDALEAEIMELNAKIDREKRAEEMRKQVVRDKVAKETPEAKVSKKFSLGRAISALAEGKRLDGAEAEMDQEGKVDMRRTGGQIGGNSITLPSWMLKFENQKRDLTAGGSATGAEYVADVDMGHVYGLEVSPIVLSLGAQLFTGLTGDIYMPKTGAATAAWETETSAANETTPATSRIQLSPNRLSAFIDVSLQLLRQYNATETIIRTQLQKAVNRALDAAAINGTGTNEPLGVLSLTNANRVTIGTDGGAITRAKLVEMWKKIADDNAELGTLAFLTTPGVKAKLMELNVDTGSGRFVWENEAILGYNAFVSNNVPANLTKGTGTNLHAVLLGVWDQLIVAQWGGVDIMVNPYTKVKDGLVEVVTNSFWDTNAFHDEAFCYINEVNIA